MPRRKQPVNAAGNNPAPSIYQVQGPDPSIWDMNAAIAPWTELVNTTLPSLFNAIKYLQGVIDGL